MLDYKSRENNIHLHVSDKEDQNPYPITEIGYDTAYGIINMLK